jgi:hypothetical protein
MLDLRSLGDVCWLCCEWCLVAVHWLLGDDPQEAPASDIKGEH